MAKRAKSKAFKSISKPKMASFSQKPGGRQTGMDPSEIPHGIFCLMKSPTSHSLKYDEKKAGTRCFRMFQTKPRLKMAFSANSVSQLSFYVFLLFPSMAQQEFYSSSCSISDSFFFFLVLNASLLEHPVYRIPSQNIWES